MSRNTTTQRETERTETDPPEESMNTTTDQTQAETNSDGDHIRIESLRKTFDDGAIVACDDVNIDIDEGEFVILVGPSGCGKTTTLRCIAGLEEPDQGQILIDGEDITGRKSKDRNLAFVFQSIALFPHMSVRKNIRFGLDMNTDLGSDEKSQRVEDVAETLGLAEMLDRKPSALSGGQQQRVSLGRAMVMEPKAFLLDEPFSALDANLRDEMRVEVKKIQRDLNTAMVFVTHDQEEAMTLGDKIVVMNDGHVQQIGTPYEIYNDPKNRFVADFIGSPSPNLVECTVERTEDGLAFVSEFCSIPATEEQIEHVEHRVGETLVYGIRPEYLDIVPDGGAFVADLDVVEPLGDRDAIHLSANGTSLSAVAPQGEVARGTDRVNIDIQTEESWLFEQDGTRIV
ncbi:ABC transporter ATP-binding protein [Haloarcula japonica]|uniref:ABC-type D-xylose/L-arabinose transporter n=1 Tax=Haloarcula japonica (strain ATCC 49778 / DSM 6131 / JCM 7785 / NBRC 101032 / NCIMB 13157 / TR-1) TaxID=1227453 RepID=M0L0F3_HALJT|nr:ABC transporter ATP-binding protein [Haloarcula japonica]EMA27027.1 glycerol-3-phosphate-transporting ATPase [Haloarcula japonica DSM 6131]